MGLEGLKRPESISSERVVSKGPMNSQEGRKDSEKGFGEASRGGGALGKENGESQGPEVEKLYLRDRKSHFERKRNVLADNIPL